MLRQECIALENEYMLLSGSSDFIPILLVEVSKFTGKE